MSRLDDILAAKRREVEALRSRGASPPGPLPRDIRSVLARAPGASLRLIAEVKMKSPSAGDLSRALEPSARALAYAEAGATMVSILCDAPFFGGAFADLADARARLDAEGRAVPLLAKEFVLDEVQLDAARAAGADAVLLIARIVPRPTLTRLTASTRSRGMEPLVEVTDEDELGAAIDGGAHVIGVNARDLDTLVIDKLRAARVLAAIPRSMIAIHLSGIGAPDAVRDVAGGRADAALVGEALMRKDDPRALLAAMVAACGARA